ncbi:MAG: DUF3293 domain-containing protein [Ferrovum sp.]|nr:DUF3293 domain-containing protein [Ferrovum sp.]
MTTNTTETGSSISNELLTIYQGSDYRVIDEGGGEFVMHIDVPCPELKALMVRQEAATALFISAWNPASVLRSDADNQAAQYQLEAQLKAQGNQVFYGIGEDPQGDCPGEPCLLALNWSRSDALALARHYGQNAILWMEADGVPRLLLSR